MEQTFLNTPVLPGEILTHRTEGEDGEIIGWLIGDMDGNKVWIGQMVAADLALAGITDNAAEEPIIWIAAIRGPASLRIRGMIPDYDTAELFSKTLAETIRAQIGRVIQ